MAEKGPNKDTSASKAFTFVSGEDKVVIDLSKLPEDTGTIVLNIGENQENTVEIKRPVKKLVPVDEEIAKIEPKAFEPGFVFREEILPENKKYLAGALCLEKYEDGRFLTVSTALLGDGGSLHQLEKKILSINEQFNCCVAKGTHEQYSVLLDNEEFVRLAGIDDQKIKAFWVSKPDHIFIGAPVRWNCENSRQMYAHFKEEDKVFLRFQDANQNDVDGRFFSIENEFDLLDAAPL